MLHLHKWISQRAYELQEGKTVGEVRMCLKCGTIQKTGNVMIPEHYIQMANEIGRPKGEKQ